MGREIERKYLVTGEGWRQEDPVRIRQGYLSTEKQRSVRVRRLGEKGILTIKGPTEGASRLELEYEIPTGDADLLLDELCKRPLIEKLRHRVPVGDHLWEVDEFLGANQGLVLAEVELRDEDEEPALPGWVGEEVTEDGRYYNAYLADHPYRTW